MNVYTLSAKEREIIEKAERHILEASSLLSEITLNLTKQEEDYEEAQARQDKVEEEYAEWKTTQEQGLDRKGDY